MNKWLLIGAAGLAAYFLFFKNASSESGVGGGGGGGYSPPASIPSSQVSELKPRVSYYNAGMSPIHDWLASVHKLHLKGQEYPVPPGFSLPPGARTSTTTPNVYYLAGSDSPHLFFKSREYKGQWYA